MTHGSDDKRALLKELLRRRGTATGAIPRIAKGQSEPASYAQERLWFLDQLAPGEAAYNISAAVRLTGPLDVSALERSLTEIVARHEVLRTYLVAPEGRPLQLVTEARSVTLPIVDLGELASDDRDRRMRTLAAEEASRPFDLAADLMLRATLVRLGAREHVVVLTMHHVASDGWSLGVFVRELSTLYRAFVAGEPPKLPPLAIQYGDYARWQREWLQGNVLQQQLAYWKRQLAGAPPVLALPTDRPRPPTQSNRGARQSVAISREVTTALKGLCQRENATPFMALLSLFQALLSRWSGQHDIVVGTPVANRKPQTDPLIGFFVNTIVLRGDLSGEPTLRQLLAKSREAALDAFSHQDVPFERVVEELQPERSLAHHPVFQVMFVLQNAPFQPLQLGELRIEYVPIETGTSKFDLLLSLDELDGAYVGHLEYATDLFDASTAARMARHFERLVANAVASPARALSALPILDVEERGQVLRAWNQPSSTARADRAVHRLFEDQALRTPDATAVVFAGEPRTTCTYRELEARANQLARHLAGHGVGPDSPVGICVERSLDMVVAVLGVMKAGGACVPLDPAYPKDRLAFMLEDTRAPVIVTQRRLDGELPAHAAKLVYIDDWAAIARESPARPQTAVGPDHVGYIIYTSGSTGRPKGIALPHRALTNLVEWHVDELLGGARTLQFASLNFDASFHEMLAAFATGGEVHVITEALRRDTPALARYIDDAGLEKVILPVVVLQQIAEGETTASTFARLREVTTTGEQLQITRPIVRMFRERPHMRLHNHYGPSETHVVTALALAADPDTWPMHPSIGRAIRGTQMYVLDHHLAPTPIGVIGELYIGGVMLARGYHARPELTAEKFVPDPFSDRPGGRLYRTGDLARLQPNGEIQFLGRADHQVKIRGFRVELGEVEAVLGKHADVREVVVIARDEGGAKRLVAYVVPETRDSRDSRDSATPSVGELRAFLAAKLPEHMIPSAFVLLDHLPLTANGKVDRRALPAPDDARPSLAQSYVAPRTPTERALVEIWQRVLRVAQVGIDDGFFELGGHSMLAVQLVTQVRRALGIELPLRALFDAPTVAGLARTIDRGQTGSDSSPIAPAIPRRVDRDAFPVSWGQELVSRIEQAHPDSRFYYMGVAVWLDGTLDRGALERALADVFARHEVLRARFRTENGRLAQTIAPPEPVVLATVDFTHLPEAERDPAARAWAEREGLRRMHLDREPPIRVALARVGTDRHVLLLVVDHIAFDGYSTAIFFRDLAALYQARRFGAPSPLPALAFDYSDFAAWLAGEQAKPESAAEIAWWKRRLEGFTPVPLPRRAGAESTALTPTPGDVVPFTLPAEVFERIVALGRRERMTLLFPMLAAFLVALRITADREDVAVGNTYVYRDFPGATDVIGYFAKGVAVRVAARDQLSLADMMARVRDEVLEARARNTVTLTGIAGLAEVYRTSFNFLPPAPQAMLPGLRVSGLQPITHGETLFDLAVFMQAREDGVSASVLYRPTLYERSTIEQLVACYQRVLAALADDPAITVGAVRGVG